MADSATSDCVGQRVRKPQASCINSWVSRAPLLVVLPLVGVESPKAARSGGAMMPLR